MKKKIISLAAKHLARLPNLTNYEKEYQRFSYQNPQLWQKVFLKDKRINAAYNAVDSHLNSGRKEKIALYWQGANGEVKTFTFADLAFWSNKLANVLKKYGIKKGDRVFIFLPRVPELYISFLAILKLGAIAGTLFPAFQPQALKDRLGRGSAKLLITNQVLKKRVDQIKKDLPSLAKILLIEEDFWPEIKKAEPNFKIVATQPTDPAFMLYTSATGNTPVCGIVIPHQGIIQQIYTAKTVLDLRENDIYWCTADPGWVTGVVYGILAPWALGVSQVSFEGRFSAESWYQIIEKYKVNVWYTAPTALRMLASEEKTHFQYDLTSLRHINSVGEALPEATILWAMQNLKRPVHDTWWQTETGAIMIANFPCLDIKPGSMGKPVPGIKAAIVNDQGEKLTYGQIGNLAFQPGWPSMMINIWGNPSLYQSYFQNGWYISGDLAYQDQDGYFWFVGRAKDIIKTAGERVGPFEVESALVTHPKVAEAGVIGKPDPLRGEIIKAFIVLKKGVKVSEALKQEIMGFVKQNLAGHAYPREIEFIDQLPKNRSGKIVRRILKAKELGLPLGETSTLEETT